jgi:hypothetical protein
VPAVKVTVRGCRGGGAGAGSETGAGGKGAGVAEDAVWVFAAAVDGGLTKSSGVGAGAGAALESMRFGGLVRASTLGNFLEGAGRSGSTGVCGNGTGAGGGCGG